MSSTIGTEIQLPLKQLRAATIEATVGSITLYFTSITGEHNTEDSYASDCKDNEGFVECQQYPFMQVYGRTLCTKTSFGDFVCLFSVSSAAQALIGGGKC